MKPEIMAIPGLTSEEELDWLFDQACDLPDGAVLEIGTFNGRATAALCLAVGDDRVVSVDSYRMKHHGENCLELASYNLTQLGYRPVLLDCEAPLPVEIANCYILRLAMMFLDAQHHPKEIEGNMDAYEFYFAEGAKAIFHDYGDPAYAGYTEAINRYFDGNPYWERIPSRVGTMVGFVKKPE